MDQQSRSNRTAASIGPNESDRADSAAVGGLNHYGRRRYHDRARRHDHAPIRSARAPLIAVPTGTAAAFRTRAAKTSDRAGNQSCREKIFHFFSLRLAATRPEMSCAVAKVHLHLPQQPIGKFMNAS